MKKNYRLNLFVFFAVIFLFSYSISGLYAQCPGSPFGNISSSSNPFNGCSGVVVVNGVFTIDGNYTIPVGVTELRISGAGASLTFSGNHTLTFANSGALLSLISGATLTATGGMGACNSNKVIRIGSGGATCDGTWSGMGAPSPLFSFTTVQSGKGFNSTSLPVELSSFLATLDQSFINLAWQTATELNNAKFIVETSHQGETFQPLGEVAGAGTTTEPQNYSFTHHTPSAGINYYRLKQVDFDGTFEYSKVIAINAPGSNDVFAFPNPAREKISVQYDQSKGAGTIQLLDALGRRINANIAGYAGNYEVTLPESLARGTYWLKVERNGKVQTLPVVKE